MGQSKGGGYIKKEAVTPEQKTLLDQLLAQAGGNTQQAAQGYAQFLPGGGGGEPIIKQAQQRFQQQTIPSILNAYGSDSKGGSALNQALAAGAANLNTDLGAQLAQMQLQAAQGIGGLGLGQAGLGAQTPQFAYAPKQLPNWVTGSIGGVNAAANLISSIYGGGR